MSPRFAILEVGSVKRAGSHLDATVHIDCAEDARAYAVRMRIAPLTGEHLLIRAEQAWGNDGAVHPLGEADDQRRRELERACENWPELDEAIGEAWSDELAAEDHDYGCVCGACSRQRHAREQAHFVLQGDRYRERLAWLGLPDEED